MERRLRNWLELLQIVHAKEPKDVQRSYQTRLRKMGSRSPAAGGMTFGQFKRAFGNLEMVHVKEHKRHAV